MGNFDVLFIHSMTTFER